MVFRIIKEDDDGPRHYWFNWRWWMGWHNTFLISGQFCGPYHNWKLELSLGDQENVIAICFYNPLFFLSMGLESRPLSKLVNPITRRRNRPYSNGRDIGIDFYEGRLSFSLWDDPMEHRATDPFWYRMSIDFPRLLKGKGKFTTEIIEERDVLVPMPEKAYAAHVKRVKCTTTYPRWFKKESFIVSIDITEKGGIPFEGKGENSWDCGHDATHGFSTHGASIPHAVGGLVGSVLRSRVQYGGWGDWNWQKESKED